MKIVKENTVFEKGEKFYCINFDDETYICLTENEYNELLKIIENELELKEFIESLSSQDASYSSSDNMSNIGFSSLTIFGIIFIYFCVKIWYSIPLIIGVLVFVAGVVSLLKCIVVNRRKLQFLRGTLFCIVGFVSFYFIMLIMVFLSFLTHIGMSSNEIISIHSISGYDRNTDIGFVLTCIGSFLLGAFSEIDG